METLENSERLNLRDAMDDFTTPVEMKYLDECIENSNPLTLDELGDKSPELSDYLDRLDKRLGGEGTVFMDSLRFYETDTDAIICTSDNPDFKNSTAVIKGEDVYAKAGSRVGDMHKNEFINETVLLPNSVYHIDECLSYRTDHLGRVIETRENINDVGDDRIRKENLKPIADAKDGLPTDVGGHLVADNVNGPTESINIIPQDRTFNISGPWKEMENQVQKAKSEGIEAIVSKKINYEGDSFRPTSLDVTTIIDGKKEEYHFENH